jgi:hypothetical protein
MAGVQIPGNAVSEGADVLGPTRALLEDLSLLGTPEDTARAGTFASVLAGPPQSVALIEAGATAASKWWASGLGASAIALWASVYGWWSHLDDKNLRLVGLGGAALVTATLVASIAYLIASDVRGRAGAAVATINARAKIAETVIQAAQEVYVPSPAAGELQLVALPRAVKVRNLDRPAADEGGWRAVAIERQEDGSLKYVVVKGSSEATAEASRLEFV